MIQTLVHPLQMLMTNGIIAVAVYLALTNKDPMYLGAIFAFMIMTQRVTMPVIQAAQSIVQIDEARRALRTAPGSSTSRLRQAAPGAASARPLSAGSNSAR